MVYYKKIAFLVILIPVVAGTATSLLLKDVIGWESEIYGQGNFTEFYITKGNDNISVEKYISSGEYISYTATVENHENKSAAYELKMILDKNIIYDEHILLSDNASTNKTLFFSPEIFNLTVPVAKLEFLLYRDGELYRSIASQVVIHNASDSNQIISGNISENIAKNKTNSTKMVNVNKFIEAYKRFDYIDNITYIFYTGEMLQINTSNNTSNKVISINNITYKAIATGKGIIFLGDKYEEVLPNKVVHLYHVTENITNTTLKINETLNLKNNYSIIINQISDDISDKIIKLKILKNNMTMRDIINRGNSSIEYWVDINDYKKQKVIQIIPKMIGEDNVVLDINQYGSEKIVNVGDNYGEFVITDVTEDSIILKSTRPLEIETGKVLTLMNGKIKIKV